ncbi:MAG: 4-hydroxy-3-methylbut-2-en-1-yl diphosphate synthase [Dehalococcoidia bacterium]|nr:4-hydroxy-3-methylbut-2-en-1-yl diphosphate synthase [Dehalococcoidia bacterium]MQG15714.1 flavodoxin-dependent (E)-4-hydroxy-3-methylbut-2-enyl-diphosphate synthase [SAR202 cluster bacterium]|tara:strand:+ start:10368 stop:11507 length:1140 start_codon:yes stop_codon:yes gene_type:complete
MKRRITKSINVGGVKIGGDAQISVQSMTKTDTRDVKATVSQIKGLEEVGCQIVRCAVPDMEAAEALAEIKKQVKIPIVADIHFHHQLALKSLESGVDCLRLNPGNIRDRTKVEEIVKASKERSVPIRIGVNFGSLPPVGKIGLTGGISRHTDGVNELPKAGDVVEGQFTIVDHMVETGLWEIGILENLDFDLIKISLKAFDIDTTVEAYRRMANLVPYPLHLGITEAGTAKGGSIRSSIGLGILLYDGIGDTIRVSLSDEPNEEIITGLEILKSLGLRKEGATLVACPSCGRADVDIRKLANTVEDLLRKTKTPVKVAVMGCEVNGPGEAKDADVGIAAGVGRAIIFRKGKKSKIVQEEDMLSALMDEITEVEKELIKA